MNLSAFSWLKSVDKSSECIETAGACKKSDLFHPSVDFILPVFVSQLVSQTALVTQGA